MSGLVGMKSPIGNIGGAPVGGGSGKTTINIATADITKQINTVLADIPGLAVAVEASQILFGVTTINYHPNLTTVKFGITVPAAITKFRWGGYDSVGGSGASEANTIAYASTSQQRIAFFYWSLQNGPNAGNLQFQFAQSSPSANISTCFKESMIRSWVYE